jgi:hypothetical protein
MFRVIKSAEDFKLLQSDTNSAQIWWIENYININKIETNIISFTPKTKRSILITMRVIY